MDQSLTSVMRNINDALRLDDNRHDKEAYQKYLDCMLCITCNLQQYVRAMGGDVVITKQVTKQVKLAQQCVDRVAVLVENIGSTQRPVVLTSPQEEVRAAPVKPKPFVVVPPLPPENTFNTFARAKVNSPMEVAYKQNQQLMAAYKARLKRMNQKHPGTFNLSLTIQRKMAENLAIAKKTEMALAKKMQERQERLEEQAAKRFATPIGMSKEEQEQRQIYKKILEYEQDAKWLQAWREKLSSASGGGTQELELICQLIQEILLCRDHPLTVLLRQYQYRIYEKLYPLVANKRQRLEAVIVPLDHALWPPELRPDAGRGGSNVEGGGEGKGEEDEEVLTDQDPSTLSQSVHESKEIADTDQDLSPLSQSVREDAEIADSSSALSVVVKEHRNIEDVSGEALNALGHRESDGTEISSDVYVLEDVTEKDSSDDIDYSDLKSGTLTVPSENPPDSSSAEGEKEDMKTAGDSPHMSAESGRESVPNTPCEEHGVETSDHSDFPSSSSLSQVVEDTKENTSQAILKGEQLQTQLKSEQARAARILRQVTQDYEKYNAENMDDLFDDDEEDREEDKTSLSISTQPTNFQTSNSLESPQPVSLSMSSQSSFGDADSRSGSMSSGFLSSSQDFPSLPPGDEDPAEMARLSKEAYQRHLKNISSDVHQYMEKLLVLFTIAYEQLAGPQGRDQCYASLEETFFKPLWKFLLMLFRLANYKEELSVACKMTQKMEVGPRYLGVTDRLCLLLSDDGDHGDGEGPDRGQGQGEGQGQNTEARTPYSRAIGHLRCISNHYTMLGKLECVVKVVHLIFDSIREFYLSQGCAPSEVPSVGADDLLPVMSYVVMRSGLPQLVSECAAMAEFIHEGYMMGQEGYCLTTLETAVSFIVSSDLSHPLTPT